MSKYLGYIAFVFILLFLTYMLKSMGFAGGQLLSSVGIVGIMMAVIVVVREALGIISDSAIIENVSDVAAVAVKMMGVGYIFGIAADVCREMGENGIATACLTLGRVEILLFALPYLGRVLELATGLLSI